MNRLADRLLALLLLATAMACLVRVYLLASTGAFAWSDVSHPLADPASLRLPMFLAAALACALGALLFWNGLLPGRPSHQAGAPLFGRAAELQGPGRPRLRQVFLVLPAVAVLVLLADRFAPWRAHDADAGKSPGGEIAAPAEPKGQDVAIAPPAPQPVSPPPEQAAKTPEPASPPAPPPPQTVAPLPQPLPQPTQPDGHRDAVVWLAVAPDGHSMLSASTDHTIKLWDIDGKRLIRNLGAHKDMARTALFLPDGARALTAGDDGEIVLRSLADGAVLHVFSAGDNGGVNKLAISPDGKRAVSGHEAGTVIVWDLDKYAVLHVMPGHDWPISAVAVSPDGSRAISGSIDGTLKLWDIDSGKQLRSWHGHEQGAYGAVFTADGHHALTGSGDDTIKLWDLDTGREVRRFDGHSGTVYALALSSDGKRLLSGSLDGTARLWDMATGNEIALFDSQSGPIYAVAFAADGTILTGGHDRTIRDWPAAGGAAVALFPGAPD